MGRSPRSSPGDPGHLKEFELWQKVWPRWRRNACLVANFFEGLTPSFEAIIAFHFGTVEFHAKEAVEPRSIKISSLSRRRGFRMQTLTGRRIPVTGSL